MTTGTDPKNAKKSAAKTPKPAARATAAAKGTTGEDTASATGPALDRAEALSELKEGLAATAQAAGHTAEVLAADAKSRAGKATRTVKDKTTEAATAGGRLAERVPKPVWGAAIGLVAAGGGLLVKWVRGRKTEPPKSRRDRLVERAGSVRDRLTGRFGKSGKKRGRKSKSRKS